MVVVAPRSISIVEIFRTHSAYYRCPQRGDGTWAGSLVGHPMHDEQGNQYVAQECFNIASVEANEKLFLTLSLQLNAKLREQFGAHGYTGVCELPGDSGRLATALSIQGQKARFARLANFSAQPKIRLVLAATAIYDFSPVAQAIRQAEKNGAEVVGVACLVNCFRRDKVLRAQAQAATRLIPTISLEHHPIIPFRHNDPRVRGQKIIPHPQAEWDKLLGLPRV